MKKALKPHSNGAPAHSAVRRLFLSADGSLRRPVKLLAALAAVLSAAWAVPLSLTALFQQMFAAWA
jgi:hypothetical protein